MWLVDGEVKGEDAKRLKLQLNCGERTWQIDDGVFARLFKSSEQLNKWLAAIDNYVLQRLLKRLRDTCMDVWDEALAKASDDHGVRRIDLTALANAQIKELRQDKSKALAIKPGTKKGTKHSKVHLSKRQVEIDLPKFIEENGEDTTRKKAAKRFGLTNEKALDRALAQHGKRWRTAKNRSTDENKKRTLNYLSTFSLYAYACGSNATGFLLWEGFYGATVQGCEVGRRNSRSPVAASV